ncbi:MAG: hypothetical protein CSYNP_00587 [Syntrophus sp. SKADARSKE-3]|nr:hypothetical protein [Syntrophus sp. SKADARSKE-3]
MSPATTAPDITLGRPFRIDGTATAGIVPAKHAIDDCRGASHTGLNEYGAKGAIPAAGPTFHAGVAVGNADSLVVKGKDVMGTNVQACAAAGTFLRGDLQGNHVFKIGQIIHSLFLI